MKELHDIGYRGRAAKSSRTSASGQNAQEDRQSSRLKEEERRILPVRTILVVIFMLAIGYWQLRDYITWGETAKGTDVQQVDLKFDNCTGGNLNRCVSSGDSFVANGRKVRLADIEAPRVTGARCDAERQLGEKAAARLQTLLSAGLFELRPDLRGSDAQGRMLAVAVRDGVSLGGLLENEGLARTPSETPTDWCA